MFRGFRVMLRYVAVLLHTSKYLVEEQHDIVDMLFVSRVCSRPVLRFEAQGSFAYSTRASNKYRSIFFILSLEGSHTACIIARLNLEPESPVYSKP